MKNYPLFLTTGRVVSQYLSGTQTRRIGALVGPESGTSGGDSFPDWLNIWDQRRRLDDGDDTTR